MNSKILTAAGSCFRLKEEVKPMEVHFTPEQEAQLAQIAATAGTDPEGLVKDAAMRLLQEDS